VRLAIGEQGEQAIPQLAARLLGDASERRAIGRELPLKGRRRDVDRDPPISHMARLDLLPSEHGCPWVADKIVRLLPARSVPAISSARFWAMHDLLVEHQHARRAGFGNMSEALYAD
jgi:hypothetical protein